MVPARRAAPPQGPADRGRLVSLTPMDSAPDALDGFAAETFTSSRGRTLPVWRLGTGPAVIVVHEVPGITPAVAGFARRVAGRGLTAVLPSLLGQPGRPLSAGYGLASFARACVSREFTVLATVRSSPVAADLRELARAQRDACGGPGVGVVGMCLTGGFALALAADDAVLAPVMSQPALPLPLGRRRRGDLGVSREDAAAVARRAREGLCVMGLRFSNDAKSPPERFDALRALLGDAFLAVEIDSSRSNATGYAPHAHSVLTEDYVDDPGSPTRAALEGVLDFLAGRLGA